MKRSKLSTEGENGRDRPAFRNQSLLDLEVGFSGWPFGGVPATHGPTSKSFDCNDTQLSTATTPSPHTITMATNSIKLLTGNSYPQLAQLVADRYVMPSLNSPKRSSAGWFVPKSATRIIEQCARGNTSKIRASASLSLSIRLWLDCRALEHLFTKDETNDQT